MLTQTHLLQTTADDPSAKGSTSTSLLDLETKTGTLPYYPTGTVHWRDVKKNIYYLAVPKDAKTALTTMSGLGQTHSLTVESIDPTGRGSKLTTAADIEAKTGAQLAPAPVSPLTPTVPIHKRKWFWPAVAGGVLVLGVGGWLLLRKKR